VYRFFNLSFHLHFLHVDILQTRKLLPHGRWVIVESAVQHGRNAGLHNEPIGVLDLVPERRYLVGGDHVPVVCHGPVGPDDADVAVAPRPEVVEDPGPDRALDEGDGIGLAELAAPAALKDGHGGQAPAAHGGVRELPGAAVGVDLVDVRAGDVAPAQDEGGADVALVVVQEALQVGAGRDSRSSSRLLRTRSVVFSVSAAVPAPQQ
jgi:hypothetical protein